MALDLAGSLVLVEVERPPVVGDLARAVVAPDIPNSPASTPAPPVGFSSVSTGGHALTQSSLVQFDWSGPSISNT